LRGGWGRGGYVDTKLGWSIERVDGRVTQSSGRV
jgi:hypothetical protein